tara:strand:+ start:333 stop:509 length:177 start_codon:yes stop_codon:yes gene_type:complete
MNITKAKYRLDLDGKTKIGIETTINGINMNVPLDPQNTEYIAIQEWAKIDGNTIEDAD